MSTDIAHSRRSLATALIAAADPVDLVNKGATLRRIFGEPGQTSDEAGVVRKLMDENGAGVAVFAESGELLFANGAYWQFDLPSGLELRERYRTSTTGTVRIRQDLVSSTSVKVVELEGGFSVVTDPVDDRLGIRDKAFGYLLDPSLADEDILRRTALALGRASGWRWIGVSRFAPPDPADGDPSAADNGGRNVDFVGWWDAAELKSDMIADITGTADEVAITTEEFCYYDGQADIQRRFPEWAAVNELPIKSYAGLVYRIDGKPAGHIMAMHDSPGTSREVVEDLLRLFSHFVGVHLELEQQRDRSRAAREAALVDPLTGLGNRAAFDEQLVAATEAFDAGTAEDVLLLLADIDNLGTVNDQHGQAAGDRYIKLYAEVVRKMWRPSDHFFRIGVDRYAMIITGINPDQVPLVDRRMSDGAIDLKKAMLLDDIGIDVSYGMAFISQHGGDIAAAIATAEALQEKMGKTHRIRGAVAQGMRE